MFVPPLHIGDLVIDPPVLQAPMAGFTNAAFREVVRQFGGVGLLATEMVNARGFVWMDEHVAEHPDVCGVWLRRLGHWQFKSGITIPKRWLK